MDKPKIIRESQTRVFREIGFESSYKTFNPPRHDRPKGHHRAGGKVLYDFIIKNKFRKIIDFGSWVGGSVICEAQALSVLSDYDNISPNIHAHPEEIIKSLHEGSAWRLHPPASTLDKPFLGEVKVYDKFWDGEFQNGNITKILENIREYDCYQNVQFIFQKVDIWDWIKNPEPFDLLHIDIHNSVEIILEVANALKTQIDAGSVILFTGGALRYGHNPAGGQAPFGEIINEDGVDVSQRLTSIGDPSNYKKLKEANLGISILTQKYPGLICVDRRQK
ncbi:MAG: hypothetical protein CMB80_24710 [Flammeovirgaceae bacterium]|nr:hypothetical protein [Flammeovirgaceae bacterium]